jgi:predicted PurR-regulated permease PerM
LPSLAVAVARLFPFVGVVFGTGAAVLAGGVDGPAWAVLAGLVALTVHVGLERLVSRRLLRQRPGNPVILIFAAMVLVDAYGLIGLVLAPLAAAAVLPTLESAMALRTSVHPTPARDLPELRARLDALKAKAEAAPPEVQSLVARLDGLVGAAAGAQVS